VTKYISSRDNTTFEETVKAAELFQKQTATLIPDYDCDCVINTDKTGCEYHVNIRRTLSHQGEKTTEVLVRDIKQNYAFLHCTVCHYSIG
jgi:hypothetical protein